MSLKASVTRLLSAAFLVMSLGVATPDAMPLRTYYDRNTPPNVKSLEVRDSVDRGYEEIKKYLTGANDANGNPKSTELMDFHLKRAALVDRIYKYLAYDGQGLAKYLRGMHEHSPDMEVVDAVKSCFLAMVEALEEQQASKNSAGYPQVGVK